MAERVYQAAVERSLPTSKVVQTCATKLAREEQPVLVDKLPAFLGTIGVSHAIEGSAHLNGKLGGLGRGEVSSLHMILQSACRG